MGTQLQRDLKSPGSPFQMFLKYSPDALNHLFDRWTKRLTKKGFQNILSHQVHDEQFQVHDETSGLAVAGETFLRPLLVRPLPPDWLRAWCVIFFAFLEFVLLNTFALRHYCGHFGRKEGEVPFAPNLWPVSAGRRSVMTLRYSDNLKHTAEVGKDCKNLLLLALYHPCLWGEHFLRLLHGFDQTRLIKADTFAKLVLTWILS